MNKTGCLLRPANTRNYIFYGAEDVKLPSEYIIPDSKIPTVRDQGDTNSCVGHGLAEVMGILYGEEFGSEKILSPWYIYGNSECRKGYSGLGMFISDAVEGIRKCGTVPLPDFDVHKEPPDIINAVAQRPELAEEAEQYKIKGYVQIPKYANKSRFVTELKKAIYTYKIPIVIGSGRYFSGGGHCVVLVGWNKSDEFIFQNSWGKSYKDNGRYHIPADYIDEAYVLLDEELELPFTDVKESDWYYKSIKTAYLSGVINGATETTFEPDIPITRAEVAAIAYRVLETTQCSVDAYMRSLDRKQIPINLLPDEKALVPDVYPNEWYANAVSILLCTGIITGDSEGTFRPNDNITRAEAAAVSVRLHEYAAKKLNVKVSQRHIANTFTDVYKFDWFYKIVGLAVDYGLVTGDSEGTFRPNGNITRAEMAAIIIRNMKKIDDMLISLCRI